MAHVRQLVAEFADADASRAAVVELERRGVVDADQVRLEGFADPADEQTRRAEDSQATHVAGRGGAVGGLVGTLLGAVIGAGITLLIGADPQPAAAIGAGLGGGALLGALGFFWGIASRLPVSDGALEAVAPGDRTVSVVVRLDDDTDPEAVRPLLERHGGRVAS